MERAGMPARRGSPEERPAFDQDEYVVALTAHVDAPGEQGLQTAYELGRAALDAQMSILDLVGTHLRARSALLHERGTGPLGHMDAFLQEALAAFEVTQRGYVESHRSAAEARQRVELLRGVSEAYLAIASSSTLEGRLEQVCIQAQEFLDAEDARLEFGRPAPVEGDDRQLDEMVAEVNGSGGRLVLRAHAGKTWTDVDRRALEQLAVLISAPIDDARRLDFTQRLERVGALIAGAADQQTVLGCLLQDGVTGIGAEDAALWLVEGGDGVLVSGPAGHDSTSGAGRAGLLATVAATGATVFLGTGEAIASHLGTADGDGAIEGAWAAVPLGSGDRRLGAMGLWYDERQPFDVVQRTFILQLANRVATVLERGRAYERERLARREAEVASARFQALQELATELSRAATRRRVAQVLLRRAIRWSDARGGIVATAAGGRPFEILAESGAVGVRWPLPDGEVLVEDILRELRVAGTSAEAAGLSRDVRVRLEANGIQSVAVYPIIAGRRSIGVMVLGWAEPFAADVLDELLRAQVAMAGPALARAERYDVEHDIADTLQRSILALPEVELPGVRWSAHYRAGSAGLAGGDWYDLYALDERRLAITVGDIVGRGVQAAAAMGQLRSAARAMAQLVDDPAALLTAIDELTSSTGQGRYSSMAYLVLDTSSGALEYSIAGHPPPVIRLPDGTTELLDAGGAPLLGIECKRETFRRHIPPGTLLVVYTDGLIERRTEGVDVGIQRLVDTIRGAGPDVDPDAFCAELASRLLHPDVAADDVAIVAVALTA